MSGANVNQDALEKLANSCDDMQIQCYERSSQFFRDLQDRYSEIVQRSREISMCLSEARSELENIGFRLPLEKESLAIARRFGVHDEVKCLIDLIKSLMFDKKKCERKIQLLSQALQVYQTQGRRLRARLDDAHFRIRSLLARYGENNSILHRRLNLASRDLEEYFLPALSVENFDFQRECIPISPSHFEDQYKKILEKENFCIDEGVKEKYGIEYSQYNLPIFPSIFDFAIAEENLKKDPRFHYAEGIKRLQRILAENQDLHSRFSFDQIEQINDGMTPRGYVWYHDPNPPLGRLRLVSEEMLLAVKTPKGYDLWQKVLKKN